MLFNMNNVYFEINHRNGLIYILTHVEVEIVNCYLTERLHYHCSFVSNNDPF